MGWQSHIAGGNICRQSHELSQGLNYFEVSMDSGVNTVLPRPIFDTSVPANIITMCFGIRHALFARVSAGLSGTSVAVRMPIWERIRSNRLDESIGGEDHFYLPVTITSNHHLNLEGAVFLYILLFDQN